MNYLNFFPFFFSCILCIQDTPELKFAAYTGAQVVQDASGSRGSSWGDIDEDGDEDLFVANRGNQNNLLYINKTTDPTRPLLELVQDINITNDGGDSQGSSFADYDNDGDLDLYVANRHNQKNFLYKNTGNGTFVKIENGAVVNDTLSSTSISWVDINNDGFSDLFVASRNNEPNAVYVNDTKGGFEKLLNGSIVNDTEDTRSCVWGDFDNDGDQDLIAGNAKMPNSLYVNNGNFAFSKVDTQAFTASDYTYGLSAQDVNNDGYLDVFVANLNEPNVLLLNDGKGGFIRVENQLIATENGRSKGIVWQDYDNDGDLDLFVSNGTPGSLDDHFFYINSGNGVFEKQSETIITKHGGLAAGVTSSDINNDGRVDLFVTNWVDNSNNKLFFNLSDDENRNWIKISLKGKISPSTPYGSKVSVFYKRNGKSKIFHQFLQSQSGYASQSSHQLHFGLGNSEKIDSIVVNWPNGGKQKVLGPTLNMKHTITEKLNK